MFKKKKKIKHICGNCRLYDHVNEQCQVSCMINGEAYHIPVFTNDKCHMEVLGIEVQEIRWWSEDPKTGNKTEGEGIVKMQYPTNLKLWDGFLK
jgi:hypothetical protein